MKPRTEKAEILREYGPFEGVENVGGVTFDGKDVWFATGTSMRSFDPASGDEGRSLPVHATAGTTFDGTRMYQLSGSEILTLDPKSGAILARLPAPGPRPSGLTWAEGTLWVALYDARKIVGIDPKTGAIVRTVETARFVTGVTFVDDDLWYGTSEDDASDIRCADKDTGEVRAIVEMPTGTSVSGLEWDGKDTLYAGGGRRGVVRAIRRPR